MRIDVVRPKELTASQIDAWRALQGRKGGWDSPFLSPCWARSVEQARGGEGVRVAIVSDGGQPRAFMSATVGRVTAIAAGGAMSDYEGLVGDPGPDFDPAQLVRALGVSRYDFGHIPACQDLFTPHARGEALSWICDLPDGYEAYAAGRRAAGVSALKEIDRKRRKVERELGETVFTPMSAARADFERLVELKRSQFKASGQTDVFTAGWPLKLLDDLYSLDIPGCRGGLFTLHIGGKLAAVQFHLMGQSTIHAWIIAHEAEFDRYSPGLILFQDL
ncbi:MAG TPA: GNAT family N-acetyltransferase, partial [Caulobacteraceae bacterium]